MVQIEEGMNELNGKKEIQQICNLGDMLDCEGRVKRMVRNIRVADAQSHPN